MSKSVQELVRQAREYLAEKGYSPKTIQRFEGTWNKVVMYCEANGVQVFDEKAVDEYLTSIGLASDDLTSAQKNKALRIRCLLSIDEHGSIPRITHKEKYPLPERFLPVLDEYRNAVIARGVSSTTVSNKTHAIKRMLAHLGRIDSIDELCPDDVIDYVHSMSHLSSQTVAGHLYQIRDFLKHLCSVKAMDEGLKNLFPVILSHKYSSLPSTYSTEEIACLLSAVQGGECPLRNQAILLLASQIGMRAGDIRSLHIDDIDWGNAKITFTQHKTAKTITLPLPDECRYALIDYLKNERPASSSTRIFLKARAPFTPFDGIGPFYHVVTSRFHSAGIRTAGRKRGLHSLRHSAATNMLENNTPYPVISAILGHSNANTTRQYLRVDIEKLRNLSLEVPDARR